MNKKTIKVLVPAGALGIPFDKNALINGIKQKPDLIAIDGGCLLYTSPSPRDCK